MKTLIAAIIVAFAGSAAMPLFAADAKSPDDCKKMYDGDQVKIDACIKSLEKK